MKLIKAIVRPNMVDNIKEALGKLNIAGMTVTEVRGHGRQKGHTAVYRGREYEVSLLPKMEIEVVVPDSSVDEAIKSIIGAARTGEIGDGRVFVMPVGRVVCVCCLHEILLRYPFTGPLRGRGYFAAATR